MGATFIVLPDLDDSTASVLHIPLLSTVIPYLQTVLYLGHYMDFLVFLKMYFFWARFSLTIHSIIKIMKIKCRSTSNNYWGIFRKETSDVRLRSATSWYNNQNITVIVSENTLRHLKCIFFVLGNSFTLIKWKFYNIEDRKNGSVFRFNKLNL